MINLEFIADELNELLKAKQFDSNDVNCIVADIVYEPNVTTKIVDFELFNEVQLENAIKYKMQFLSEQNYLMASDARDIEKNASNCYALKVLQFGRIFFYPGDNTMIYYHLGVADNDRLMKEILTKIGFINNTLNEKL